MLGLASEWRLKRETESLIVAAQNQSIKTNLVKARIYKSQGHSLCRVCRKVDESMQILRILSLVREESALAKRIRFLWSGIC